ncbi:MAG TPA: sulfatase-like hydrolase/transferase [Thermodesulfobacteriota bacterium]
MKSRIITVASPFLISIYPVIFLYSENPGEIRFVELLIPFAYLLGFGLYIFGSTFFFLRDLSKTSILVSIFLVIFYSYGYLYDAISKFVIGGMNSVYFLIFVLILYGGIVILILRRKKSLLPVTTFLNVVALTLVLISIFNIFFALSTQPIKSPDNNKIETDGLVDSHARDDLKNSRDIYYIILDRYARADILTDVYNFDNSEFIQFLKHRAFYIVENSYANYQNTYLSLSSSLNMNYLHNLVKNRGDRANNLLALGELLGNFRLWQILKAKGYKYFHFGLGVNRNADFNYVINRTQSNSNLILDVIYQKSFLWACLSIFDLHRGITEDLVDGYRLVHRERVLYQLEKLQQLPKIDGPTFAFAHFLIPHPPYVFEADGKSVSIFEERSRTEEVNYLNQLKYTNKVIMDLVDILLNSSARKPIIIIQADEGPYPENYDYKNILELSSEALKQKFGILNALYLPDISNTALYADMSPVNTFRLVLNLYFGTDFSILPDKEYTLNDLDITDKVRQR